MKAPPSAGKRVGKAGGPQRIRPYRVLSPFDGCGLRGRLTGFSTPPRSMSLDSLFSSLSQKVKSDPKALLGSLLGGAGTQGAFGGAASGALVSLLMNSKSRNPIQKNAVKVGGMAALAGIGYYAYQKWQNLD